MTLIHRLSAKFNVQPTTSVVLQRRIYVARLVFLSAVKCFPCSTVMSLILRIACGTRGRAKDSHAQVDLEDAGRCEPQREKKNK